MRRGAALLAVALNASAASPASRQLHISAGGPVPGFTSSATHEILTL